MTFGSHLMTKKVVLIKDEYYPFVWMVDAEQPWTIDPKMDSRNKIVEIPDSLFQDYEITMELMNALRDRLMKLYAK